uniref:THAP-type domain-containing protein n=1 Tax=Ixodes ricinus TaxID=34613 RepID=A0A6B0VAH2_IXORI
MPLYCSAEDCTNCKYYSGRLVHTYPGEPTVRKLWIRAARPSQPNWLPSKSDWLCRDHFADEDYRTNPTLLQSLGLPTKHARLKPGVVPSLFTRTRKQQQLDVNEEKRRRKKIIDDLLGTLPQATATDTTSSTTDKTKQSPGPRHEPPHDESVGIEELCFSSAFSLTKAAQALPDLLDVATQSSDLYLCRNASTQVIVKNPSRYSQTDPVLVMPHCSSPNQLPQAQLDWTLPTGLTQSPQPPVPPEPSAPLQLPVTLQPEVPLQPPTVTSEPAVPEGSDGESFTELPKQHLEANTTCLLSDTSLPVMSGAGFLRDYQTSTSCASPLDKDNSAAINDHILERKFLIF